MKRIAVFFLMTMMLGSASWAQYTTYASDDPEYKLYVNKADSAYRAEDYPLCVTCYERVFKISKDSWMSLYNASRCHAQVGKLDQAFEYLQQSINTRYQYGCEWMYDDPDLDTLKSDARWKSTEELCNRLKVRTEATLNPELKEELIIMRKKDQMYRSLMDSVAAIHGWESQEVNTLWAKQSDIDKQNISRLEEIMVEYGYPGSSLVGAGEANAAFIIIQHAELEIQERYLPILTEAANNEELSWNSLALLIDRIRLFKGEPQVYGTQIRRDEETGEYYVYQIENEKTVDERRTRIGLPTMKEYVKLWGIEYKVGDSRE